MITSNSDLMLMVASKDLSCMIAFIVMTIPSLLFPKEEKQIGYFVPNLMVGIMIA